MKGWKQKQEIEVREEDEREQAVNSPAVNFTVDAEF